MSTMQEERLSIPANRGDIVYEETLCHSHVEEDRGVLHGAPGPARTLPQAPPTGPDPPRQGGRAGVGPAAARLHRPGPDHKWVGDFKQIDTDEGPVFLATVEDLYSRRMLGFAQSDSHPTAQLATDAINMAAAARGGDVAGVIFHADKGSPIHLRRFRGGLPPAQDHPVDGTRRLRTRQRRSRVVFLHPRTRTDLTAPLPGPETRHEPTSPPGSTPGTTGDGSTPPTT